MRIGDLCLFRQTKPLYTDRAILPNKIEGYSPDVRMLRLHTWPRCMNGTCRQACFLRRKSSRSNGGRLNVMADLSDLDAPRTVPLVERFMKAYIDEIKF